jgi:hypothetical protein
MINARPESSRREFQAALQLGGFPFRGGEGFEMLAFRGVKC